MSSWRFGWGPRRIRTTSSRRHPQPPQSLSGDAVAIALFRARGHHSGGLCAVASRRNAGTAPHAARARPHARRRCAAAGPRRPIAPGRAAGHLGQAAGPGHRGGRSGSARGRADGRRRAARCCAIPATCIAPWASTRRAIPARSARTSSCARCDRHQLERPERRIRLSSWPTRSRPVGILHLHD